MEIFPKNIIVRMPNWIGDLVMATPVLSDLRKKFPKASITAMCKIPICKLLEKDKDIDELFCFRKHWSSFLRRKERGNIIEKIREGNFDLGILLTNSLSSAWWFWQAGVNKRLGYLSFWRRLFLNIPVRFPKERYRQHLSLTYKMLLAPLGIEVSKTSPRVFLSLEEIEEAKELLYQRGYSEDKILVGINAMANYGSAKCWPKERFEEVARCLLVREDINVVFVGDESSVATIKEICSHLPSSAINLAGKTSIRELASVISLCKVFLSNDSGPMHIAAALNVPVVALFGATSEVITGLFGAIGEEVNKHIACSPCFKRECTKDFECMKKIEVEEVVEKLRKYI